MIAPSALTLLFMLFGSSPKELTKALAFYGAAAPAGGTAGVFLGGVITEYVSWPWVFYINIPIALVILALVPKVMPAGAMAAKSRVDLLGAVTVTGGLAAAVYAVVKAPEVGWGAGSTLLVLGIAAVLLAAFVAIQAKGRDPLLRLGIFKAPTWRRRTSRRSCSVRPGSRCGSSSTSTCSRSSDTPPSPPVRPCCR